jgi:hypothetical protein
VLLLVLPLANLGAVEDVSAYFAAGKGKEVCRFDDVASEAPHVHDSVMLFGMSEGCYSVQD